jgi:5-methylcytosine-specific restriction endonuclease McrA
METTHKHNWKEHHMPIQTTIPANDYLDMVDDHIDDAQEYLKGGDRQSYIDKVEHVIWHLENLKNACATQHNLKPTVMK